MNIDIFLADLADPRLILPLLFSLLTGALIGAEREFNQKPAGLRTHTLVCFASALMTLVGLRMAEWVAILPAETQVVSDMSRMPHAVLTGIGFLGAGVIFKGGATVQGLTTAATLWLTAALGVVYGTGLIELGLLGTCITIIVLVLLRAVQRLYPRLESAQIELTFDRATADLTAAISALAAIGLRSDIQGAATEAGSERISYTLMVQGTAASISAETVMTVLAKLPGQYGAKFAKIVD